MPKEQTIRLVITPRELSAVIESMTRNQMNLDHAGLSYLGYLKSKQFQLGLGTVSPAYIKQPTAHLADALGFDNIAPQVSANVHVNPDNVGEWATRYQANPNDPAFSTLSAQDVQDIKDYMSLMMMDMPAIPSDPSAPI